MKPRFRSGNWIVNLGCDCETHELELLNEHVKDDKLVMPGAETTTAKAKQKATSMGNNKRKGETEEGGRG